MLATCTRHDGGKGSYSDTSSLLLLLLDTVGRGRRVSYVRTFGRGTRLCLFRRHSALAATQFAHGSLRSHFTWWLLVADDKCTGLSWLLRYDGFCQALLATMSVCSGVMGAGDGSARINLPCGHGIGRMRELRRERPSSLPAFSQRFESNQYSRVSSTYTRGCSECLISVVLAKLTESRRSEDREVSHHPCNLPTYRCAARRDLGMASVDS